MEMGMEMDRDHRSNRTTEWAQLGLILVLAAAIVAWSLLNRLA